MKTLVPKTFIRPWEEITCNKNRIGVIYDKDVFFHVLDFSKPIEFCSVGFLDYIVPQQIFRCQYCDRAGREKDQNYDLHPYEKCAKKNHHSNICFKHKATSREKIDFGWISSWDWSNTAKKIYTSYHRICSRVLTSISVKSTSYSHLVSNKVRIDRIDGLLEV